MMGEEGLRMDKRVIAFVLGILIFLAGCSGGTNVSDPGHQSHADDTADPGGTSHAGNTDHADNRDNTDNTSNTANPSSTDNEEDAADPFHLSEQPFIGDEDAPVTVIEFSDFKCPYCAIWSNEYMDDFVEEFVETGKVKYYFVNFPFLADDSFTLAAAGEVIAEQGSEYFFAYKKALLARQGEKGTEWGTPEWIAAIIEDHLDGIDADSVMQSLSDERIAAKLAADIDIGVQAGIRAVPSFVLNDEIVHMEEFTDLAKAVRDIID